MTTLLAGLVATLSMLVVALLGKGKRHARTRAAAEASAIELAVIERTQTLQLDLQRAMKLASVGQLVAGVGHEINNPLSYVSANLELVAEQAQKLGDEAMISSLADAKDGVERIRQIVHELQIFSRTDESEHAVDLRKILERSIRMAGAQIRHAAKLVTDLREVPSICANETRLGQVFLNLLINAVQAIGDGHAAENEIRVTCFTDSNGNAIVEIKDSGPGIPSEVRTRIFEPFFTTKPIGSGTGLGLSICRTIITALRGDIVVESELGKGSLFRIKLPQPSVRRERKASLPLVPSDTRRRVLVIDDEPLICRAIERSLASEHDVVSEVSSRRALERLQSGEMFDVILCDVMMPEMSGIDLYEALRNSAPEAISRIVFMTGGVLTERASGFLVATTSPLLQKPLNAKKLRATIIESST
ncbi:MAG: ATP-binding protein [Polyangiaceae bacterium]